MILVRLIITNNLTPFSLKSRNIKRIVLKQYLYHHTLIFVLMKKKTMSTHLQVCHHSSGCIQPHTFLRIKRTTIIHKSGVMISNMLVYLDFSTQYKDKEKHREAFLQEKCITLFTFFKTLHQKYLSICFIFSDFSQNRDEHLLSKYQGQRHYLGHSKAFLSVALRIPK